MPRLRLYPAPLLFAVLLVLLFAWGSSVTVDAADHVAPPSTDATSYACVETHADEKVSIAADPFNSDEKGKFFRVAYLKYGFLPVRLIVTNTGDKPISLDQARIFFVAGDGTRINAAEPEDIERRANRPSNVQKTIPMPAPLPPIHRKPGSKDKDIEEDFRQFEYAALAVEPHTTHAGFLFYDIDGLNDPLRGARLYLRNLKGADGKELFYFEIPFAKCRQAQPF